METQSNVIRLLMTRYEGRLAQQIFGGTNLPLLKETNPEVAHFLDRMLSDIQQQLKTEVPAKTKVRTPRRKQKQTQS